MVAPFRHLATLDELTGEELFEHFDLVRRSARAIREAYKPEGFNIGINLGRVAGLEWKAMSIRTLCLDGMATPISCRCCPILKCCRKLWPQLMPS